MKKPSTAKPSGNRKASNSLVAVSSAAVLAVYAAGYTKTQAAATKLDGQSEGRRTPPPAPASAAFPAPEARTVGQPEVLPEVAPKTSRKPAEVASAKAVTASAPVETAKAVEKVETKPETVTPAPAQPAAAVVTEAKAVDTKAAEEKAAADAKPNPALPPWKDGTYEGWGSCRHGDLQAKVVIEGGRIVSSTISQCLTRYSCDIIDVLLPEPPKKQSPNVSNVSGATQSADAFYYAVYDALAKAK